MIATALVLVVAWSSVEVLWAQIEPVGATAFGDGAAGAAVSTADATAAGAAAEEPASQDDCPCFCACACQAVHVVLPAPQGPKPDRLAPTFDDACTVAAPDGRPADPPYRPPRAAA